MKLSLYEQETIILYNQAEVVAEVYTHDPRLLEKLRRLAEKYPDQIVKKDRQTFLVPKRCVSVREPYSAERRKAASERAKAAGYRPPTPKQGSAPAWLKVSLRPSSSLSPSGRQRRCTGSRSTGAAWPAARSTMTKIPA